MKGRHVPAGSYNVCKYKFESKHENMNENIKTLFSFVELVLSLKCPREKDAYTIKKQAGWISIKR